MNDSQDLDTSAASVVEERNKEFYFMMGSYGLANILIENVEFMNKMHKLFQLCTVFISS